MRERDRRVHGKRNLGAGDVGAMRGGTRAGADDVWIRDAAENDRAVGDDLHRRLRRDRGDRRDLRHAFLEELAHDERQCRNVALRVSLEECDVDIAHESRVGECLVKSFARLVELDERRDLHHADDRTAGVVAGAACGRNGEARQRGKADMTQGDCRDSAGGREPEPIASVILMRAPARG